MPLSIGPALAVVLAEDTRSQERYGITFREPLEWLPEPTLRRAWTHRARAAWSPPLTARYLDADGRIPVYLLPSLGAEASEPIDHRQRGEPRELADRLSAAVGVQPVILPASASVSVALTPAELAEALRAVESVAMAELDPLVDVGLLDTALPSIGLAPGGPALRSAVGVRIAILDSGIDASHPALNVIDQVSTYPGEPVTVPGDHGTHVSGCVASRDTQFRGVAPDADLIDIKVASASNLSNQQAFSDGIDEALQRDPHILVISLGWSHLPSPTLPGHACPVLMGDGTTTACAWCRAAETAVADNRIVIVAAGNDHARAETLRSAGRGLSYDTELCCPAQATGVIRVGAVDDTANPADFSSNGPGSRPRTGITLVGPGVDIHSTVTVASVTPPAKAFRSMKGTSQAAPIVAGAMAVLVADAMRAGEDFHADVIAQRLLRDHVTPLTAPRNIVGAGRLDLSGLT